MAQSHPIGPNLIAHGRWPRTFLSGLEFIVGGVGFQITDFIDESLQAIGQEEVGEAAAGAGTAGSKLEKCPIDHPLVTKAGHAA